MAYTIQRGDTLGQLAQRFGTTVGELQKLNPQITNPNLIYAGANLNIPGKTALPALSPLMGEGLTLDQKDLTLPDVSGLKPEDQLGLALKQMANLAMREGRTTGLAATTAFFEQRGIMPEDLPGGSIAQMLAFVDRAMVDPVQEKAQSIADMIGAITESRRETQRAAERQVDFLVGNEMWNTLDFGSRQELWDAAGYPGTAQTISRAGISSSDLMKYYIPESGYAPEIDYLLWTSTTPPEGFRQEAERRMKAEGRMREDLTLTEVGARREWDRLRSNLKKTDLKLTDLPQADQWDILQTNAALKRAYEVAKEEFKRYQDGYLGYSEEKKKREGIVEPRHPIDVVNEQIEELRRGAPEFIPHIKIPY